MTSKERARAEAAASIRQLLGKGKRTIEIRWVGGGPTPYGRTDYYEITVWFPGPHGPEPGAWLTRHVATAMGLRFNHKREAVSMGGAGYSKPYELATRLADIVGRPIHVVSPGSAFGSNGMFAPSKRGRP